MSQQVLHSKNRSHAPREPPPAPPKGGRIQTAVHWSDRIQECIISSAADGSFNGLSFSGGADVGKFCYVNQIDDFSDNPIESGKQVRYHSGRLYEGEPVLEIQGQKVGGFTLYDLQALLKHVAQNGSPIMVKTVKNGLLTKDLKQFLSLRFTKESYDHHLQQTIRDNLYKRTVPCTTRTPRPGEKSGIEYMFLSNDEFLELERQGKLLESGIYEDNRYGTPKPPSEPKGSALDLNIIKPGTNKGASSKSEENAGLDSSDSTDMHKTLPLRRQKSLERSRISDPVATPPGADFEDIIKRTEKDLGPLPDDWEMAFIGDGTPYFIDHASEATHWLDPRLTTNKDIPFTNGDLPYGWEKVEDPHYGTYYIDHVNKKTQYQNPCIKDSKRSNSSAELDVTTEDNASLPRSFNDDDIDAALASDTSPPEYTSQQSPGSHKPSIDLTSDPFFTSDPDRLRGRFIRTSLKKSERGFGFTILGGDGTTEEFLQIKAIVHGGQADLDAQLRMGDVLVYINERCVLGYTHEDVVSTFQCMQIGSQVTLEVCRGYPLPFDPDDPNTEFVTRVAVEPKLFTDLSPMTGSETLSIGIVKGQFGFGFTIADSQCGQRVKKILDVQRCKTLREGDRLISINENDITDATHRTVVDILSQCKCGHEAKVVIKRAQGQTGLDHRLQGSKDLVDLSRSFSPSRSPGHAKPMRSRTTSEGHLIGSNSGQYSVSAAASSSVLNGQRGRHPDNYNQRSFNQNEKRRTPEPLRSRTPGPEVMRYHGEQHPATAPTAAPVSSSSSASALHNGYRTGAGASLPHPDNTQQQQQRMLNFGTPDFIPASRYQVQQHPQSRPPSRGMDLVDVAYSNDLYGLPLTNQQPRMVNARSHDALSTIKDRYPSSIASSGGASSSGDHRIQVDLTVILKRQENGFGFRIVGGTEEGSQVCIGRIMPGGSADSDGRLRTGDTLVYIDTECVLDSTHRHAVACMQKASTRQDGRVSLAIRRDQMYDPRAQMAGMHLDNRASFERPSYDPQRPASSAAYRTPSQQQQHPPPTLEDSRQPLQVALLRRDRVGFGFEFTITRNGGFIISEVTDNGPAAQSQQIFSGDLLIAIDDLEVPSAGLTRINELSNLLNSARRLVNLTIVPQNIGMHPATAAPPMTSAHAPPPEGVVYSVNLHRGSRGFGFSIRGGREFNNMPLYVLRVADGGAADLDGRLKVADELLEIGGYNTSDMTHNQAINLIQDSGNTVTLRLRRPPLPPKSDVSRINYKQSEQQQQQQQPFYQPSSYKPRPQLNPPHPSHDSRPYNNHSAY